jgi:carbonic anhydrase/acetyltransferase-like protein (isoleucine patch superfamily)
MIAVTIPTTDVNSESAVIVRWYVDDGEEVHVGQAVVEIETSKAVLDIDAPSNGIVLRLHAEGEQVKIEATLAYVFETAELLERYRRDQADGQQAAGEEQPGRITAPARRRAAELGVDINEVARSTDELVTSKLVEAFAAASADLSDADLPEPLQSPSGVRRLVLIGGGLAATQVIDILLHDDAQQAVAIVDDDASRVGELMEDVPIVGPVERAFRLFADRAVDAAVICVGTSIAPRTRLRKLCEEAGLPMANVIDPTARIATGVTMGTGNIICANTHFGVGVSVGSNNLISAHNSFDHHSVLGTDITTGPGCVTSGLVTIEDRCRFGMGVFIEPRVVVGAGSQVSSGAVIVSSVPPEHAVKTKVITTSVVPMRRS